MDMVRKLVNMIRYWPREIMIILDNWNYVLRYDQMTLRARLADVMAYLDMMRLDLTWSDMMGSGPGLGGGQTGSFTIGLHQKWWDVDELTLPEVPIAVVVMKEWSDMIRHDQAWSDMIRHDQTTDQTTETEHETDQTPRLAARQTWGSCFKKNQFIHWRCLKVFLVFSTSALSKHFLNILFNMKKHLKN